MQKVDYEIITLFFEHPSFSDQNARAVSAFSPPLPALQIAVGSRKYQIAKQLIEAGANLHEQIEVELDSHDKKTLKVSALDFLFQTIDKSEFKNGKLIYVGSVLGHNPGVQEIARSTMDLLLLMLQRGADPRLTLLKHNKCFNEYKTGTIAEWILNHCDESPSQTIRTWAEKKLRRINAIKIEAESRSAKAKAELLRWAQLSEAEFNIQKRSTITLDETAENEDTATDEQSDSPDEELPVKEISGDSQPKVLPWHFVQRAHLENDNNDWLTSKATRQRNTQRIAIRGVGTVTVHASSAFHRHIKKRSEAVGHHDLNITTVFHILKKPWTIMKQVRQNEQRLIFFSPTEENDIARVVITKRGEQFEIITAYRSKNLPQGAVQLDDEIEANTADDL